jgi:4-amino-4-deoxy-L-arabinose transferase-like glycosyltransferase
VVLPTPTRPRSTLLSILLLWLAFYASVTLWSPPLLDDADSVHAEAAREMLLRHDYITLYVNGIRYLEKAPLLYWAMAASMKTAMAFGATAPRALAAAARVPLALAMLALTLLCEAFARRMFADARAGLYAAFIILSSFGMYLFTRMLIPDALVCLWITLALYALWLTETRNAHQRLPSYLFAAACALNVLTKGLIGVIFPVAIAAIYLLLTRGLHGALHRLRELHPWTSLAVFLIIAAPWHILAGLANPTMGHPAPFGFTHGHWLVPQPTDSNVRGWFWFYFINEHLLRYLNLRIPHDYDTAPLWLFWGLCLIWLMPWSVFIFKAVANALPLRTKSWRSQFRRHELSLPQRGLLLLVIWAAFVLLFFSLSSRQEYYVLPALPALAILIAGWLAADTKLSIGLRQVTPTLWILIFGSLVSLFTVILLINAGHASANTDLATLLNQHPADYTLSMGHFMDLTGPAVALFRFPTALASFTFFAFPLTAYILSKLSKPHAANLTLAAMAFCLLISVQLGLKVFAPVLTSAQLAQAIAPQVRAGDLIIIHGEYESGSTLGFYLQCPDDIIWEPWGMTHATNPKFIRILEGRSSNLWYGSFFPDAPAIFETPASLAAKWQGPQRIFLWQSLANTETPQNQLPTLPGPVYILVKNGGKEIVSNQPNR